VNWFLPFNLIELELEECKMRINKTNKLVDSCTGEMECKVCGYAQIARKIAGGRFARGSWQCEKDCEL
jgi:hypothetical protein